MQATKKEENTFKVYLHRISVLILQQQISL